MKKCISVLLTCLFLFSCIIYNNKSSVSAVGYATPEQLDGTDNLFLSYTFSSTPASGHRSKEGYLPLVGYYNTDGELKDIFFDSYLFLPCVTTTPSGGRTYRDNEHPANFSDWQLFVDDVFLDGYNIKALNEAVGETKVKLGSGYTDFKANVFLTVMYPVKTQTSFGDVDGDGKTENFNNLADRQKAIKWIIDEQLSRFNEGNFQNLNLVGFYWFEEDFARNDSQENSLLTYMNNYVHSLDYKTIWIPYYNANGYNKWASYGFDTACYQPNYMFNESATSSRINATCNTAKNLGMGVEIEASGLMFSSITYYNRYMEYLKVCTEEGAAQGVKMYYNDAVNGVFYNAYISENPDLRRIYDMTYKYASQTLDPNEITFIKDEKKYENYNIVSAGKNYTTTTPYTNTSLGYGSVSGKELTDGKFGSSNYDTEWIGFNKSFTDGGYFYINLDFGSVFQDLSLFSLEMNELVEAGISYPESIEILISDYGTDYTSLGYAENKSNLISYMLASVELDTPVNARYVQMKIKPGTHAFVFVSELTIGTPKDIITPSLTVKTGSSLLLDNYKNLCNGITNPISVLQLKAMINQPVIIKNASGIIVSDNTIVGTGYQINYTYNGVFIKNYLVCIKGDINGDGNVSTLDYLLIKRAFLGTYSLNSIKNAAADINKDNKISASDYLLIKRHFLGTYNIYS
ncbi:MAG: hypothetical protein A2Y15_05720 [Clostridiales bacterium GWF2_36_10]|nr:MAG: hypothetical protein A2Y15_05720 [Clostridiales bacterium GWF2_36_10]